MVNRLSQQNGFTLLELLLAIAILSIAIIPIMSIFPQVLLMSSKMERESRITFLAQKKLEEVKSQAISDFSQNYSSSATAFSGSDSMFKYVISDVVDNTIRSIRVTVWHDKDGSDTINGDEEWIELNTKVAERN